MRYTVSTSQSSSWTVLTSCIAPAQSVVEYETVVFTGGLREEPSKFRGSTKEVDDQWDELYNCKILFEHLGTIN